MIKIVSLQYGENPNHPSRNWTLVLLISSNFINPTHKSLRMINVDHHFHSKIVPTGQEVVCSRGASPFKEGTKSYHNKKMREWGNDLGFTHAAQIYLLGIAYTWTLLTTPNQKWMYVAFGSRTTYLSCGGSYRLIPRCLTMTSLILAEIVRTLT